MESLKGPGAAQTYDGAVDTPLFVILTSSLIRAIGSDLRVAIVHARWNMGIIGPLVEGAKKSLSASGVAQDHIEVHTVPGSYELPYTVQR